jgi:hypothetical protein
MKIISFHNFGPNTPASFTASIDRASISLSDSFVFNELELKNCLVDNKYCSVYLRYRNYVDLLYYSLCLLDDGMVYGSASAAVQVQDPINISKWLNIISSPNHELSTPIKTTSDLLVHIATKKISKSSLRHLSIQGNEFKSVKSFISINRIVMSSKNTHPSLEDGSVLLSLNNISSIDTPCHIMMKLIADLPKSMTADLVIFKAPSLSIQSTKYLYNRLHNIYILFENLIKCFFKCV